MDKKQECAGVLKVIEVLRPLCPSALETLLACTTVRSYQKGMEVQRDRGTEQGVYGIVYGAVELAFRSMAGDELPVLEIVRGELMPMSGLIPSGSDEVVAKVLASPTVLCVLGRPEFEQHVSASLEAMRILVAEQQRWIREISGVASDRLHRSPEIRIRHMLWREAVQSGRGAISYTHEQIAARVCTDRARATKVIGKLQRDGIIGVEGQTHLIRVLDQERLALED